MPERDAQTPDYYLKLMFGDLAAQVAVLRAACDQKDEEIAALKAKLPAVHGDPLAGKS